MLAGYSSTLLSPGHRLSSETPAQFQACHFTSLSTKRLDLPCNFARKDVSRSQPIRPVGLPNEKPIETKTAGCSLRQNILLTPCEGGRRREKDDFWEKSSKNLKKRYAEEVVSNDEDTCMSRSKRKRGDESLSLGQLGDENYWLNVQRSVPGLEGYQVPFSLSDSGEEERVCFVHNDVIAQPFLPPLSNIPWYDSVVTEITNSVGKNVNTVRGPPMVASGSSSTSSESHNLVFGPCGNPDDHEIGDSSTPLAPTDSPTATVAAQIVESNRGEHDCVELVSLLVSCVEQIGSKNIPALNHCLARLGELASPRGGSSIHRLIAYYTEALALRAARMWPHIFNITTQRDFDRSDDESETGWRLLNQVSPIPKFIQFTSNEILFRAFEGKDRVHIIDFNIHQGIQWPSLFQSLVSRSNPPSHVRITGIGESKQELIETGDRLARFAGALNLPFEFHPVVDRLEDVRLWMLHVKDRETVAINCAFQVHKMLYDSTRGTLNDFLGLIRSTKAETVVVAEQEASHNEVNMDARLSISLKYYSAIFDSLDLCLPFDSPVRIKIEEMFAREIRNIIACEGRDRFERHETFHKWKALMEQGGYRCAGVSEREVLQGQMLLKMYSFGDYRVDKEQDGAALTLSWSDQPLYTVSTWSPVDVAGSSSSYPQPS